jgi:uncharacterized protein
MNIIDFHTHIFPDHLAQRALAVLTENAHGVRPYTDGTLSGLRASMKKNNVTQSVLLPIATKASQVRTINESCAGPASGDCIPFGTLHPDTTDIDQEISLLRSIGVKGIKLHPEYQNFYIDNQRFFPMYEALSSAGLIVLFHAGKDPGPFTCDHALPQAFATIFCNFPRLKMVVAHLGGWMVWEDVERYIADLPVYFDTAAVREFLPAAQFLRLSRKHGIDRILFGTDSPWYDQGEDLAWLDSMNLSSDEKEKILFKNAQNLLGETST